VEGVGCASGVELEYVDKFEHFFRTKHFCQSVTHDFFAALVDEVTFVGGDEFAFLE
jgi:hypothetical protein